MNRRSFLSRLFRFSKKIHKYCGLSFLIYFLWMGSSGVLLNHPSIIENLAVSRSWLPEKYTFNNWNRMAVDGRMSLWHTLFELHNGRMFEPILGKYTWLIVPLGGFFLLITVLTGTYDWLHRKACVHGFKGSEVQRFKG